jgi:hypothetical protein
MNVVSPERPQQKVANDRPPVNLRLPSLRLAKSLFVRALSLLICLLLWQAACAHRLNLIVNFQNIPAPTKVSGAFAQLVQSSKLLTHVWSSVVRIFVGFGLAAILAVGLGLLVGRVRLAADLFMSPVRQRSAELLINADFMEIKRECMQLIRFERPEYSRASTQQVEASSPRIALLVQSIKILPASAFGARNNFDGRTSRTV